METGGLLYSYFRRVETRQLLDKRTNCNFTYSGLESDNCLATSVIVGLLCGSFSVHLKASISTLVTFSIILVSRHSFTRLESTIWLISHVSLHNSLTQPTISVPSINNGSATFFLVISSSKTIP
jgi:hypothetical protein